MGSGLILLVIVGAWLAVLVPMALRSHDATNLGTVDKFHDAMRVLSRRDAAVRAADRAVVVPPRPVADAPVRTGPSPAARRRRALLVLLAVAVATLVGGLVGPRWVLVPHVVTDLLLVVFVGWLRKSAAVRAEREWRTAMGARRPARAAAAVTAQRTAARLPSHVAGIPSRMPSRAAVTGEAPLPAPLPALRYEDPAPVPARGAQGEPWAPVPVPVPTYVTAPVAPRRVVDLTRAEGLAEAERSLGIDDQGPELDEILDRRRAVGD